MAETDELRRSAALIERLLADPGLRRRFRTDPAAVLVEHGLPELAGDLGPGDSALMTLELRESRSSLAGVMVAAAAEGVDFSHVVAHAAPGLERDAGRLLDRIVKSFSRHKAPAPKTTASGATTDAVKAPASPGEAVPATPATPATATSPSATSTPATPADPTSAASTGGAANTADTAGSALAGHADATTAGGAARASDHAPGSGLLSAHHAVGHDLLAPSAAELLRYPGNDASPEALARWMAAHARRAGIPAELPVMAALTESGLRNLDYGDRDSVGFFQMRLGIWNEGPYAGYLEHPELQMKWFIEHALEAKAEDPALAGSPSTWGEWVANVEQPAAQYRFRYQLQLDTARSLLRSADLTAIVDHHLHLESPGKEALDVATKYLGTPYRWGGATPTTGFDCSGLVQYSYAQIGIELPRVAAQQFDVGIPVGRDHLRPGDAVFFAENGYVHHVGLYIGDGKFIDAPETGQEVRVDSLSDPYFATQYAGARRYTAAALGDPASYARTLPAVG